MIDTLVGDKDASRLMGTIQFNTFMIKECFRMLTGWKAGEVYPKALVIIYGLLTVCYHVPEEGYRIFPLTVTDVNNLGKHLDKTKDQMDPLNRVVLTMLDRIASLIEPQKPMPSVEIQDVALQANNIRGKFLDMTKKLNEAIPDVLARARRLGKIRGQAARSQDRSLKGWKRSLAVTNAINQARGYMVRELKSEFLSSRGNEKQVTGQYNASGKNGS